MRPAALSLCAMSLGAILGLQVAAVRPSRTLWSLRGGVEDFSRRRCHQDAGLDDGTRRRQDEDISPDSDVNRVDADIDMTVSSRPLWSEEMRDEQIFRLDGITTTTMQYEESTLETLEERGNDVTTTLSPTTTMATVLDEMEGPTVLIRTRRRVVPLPWGKSKRLRSPSNLAPEEALGSFPVQAGGPVRHKVSLTQIGYIQFLRYSVKVPELHEFSICVWIRSHNLSHNHPIFSYSKDEKERLVRAWVSPAPAPRLHLRVRERSVLEEPLPEAARRRWVHACLSWDGLHGDYLLFVDGVLRRAGRRSEAGGFSIPGGGDVVVGQEYTDFDKGLDDGIEGDVFGFYLFRTAIPAIESDGSLDEDGGYQALLGPNRRNTRTPSAVHETKMAAPGHWRYSAGRPYDNREMKADGSVADAENHVGRDTEHRDRGLRGETWRRRQGSAMKRIPRRVRHLYAFCTDHLDQQDRAHAVVSWPTTPVRVFGGAIISNIQGSCGHF